MRLDGTSIGFSPTDLAAFSACPQRTLLDRLRALGVAKPDVYPDARLELLHQRGAEHEQRYLEDQRRDGKRVVCFEALAKEERCPEAYARRAEETVRAMRDGPDVIYQGAPSDGASLDCGLTDADAAVERAPGVHQPGSRSADPSTLSPPPLRVARAQ